jgi:hypothetical protein
VSAALLPWMLVALGAACGSRTPLSSDLLASGGSGSGAGSNTDGGESNPLRDGSAGGPDAASCVIVDGVCVPDPPMPRLVAPISASTATSRRPTFRWELSGIADGAHIEICRDHACTSIITTFDAVGDHARPAIDLPPGTLFWRAFGHTKNFKGAQASPTWELTIRRLATGVDTSWGTKLDVNADGFADMIVGQREVGTGARGTADIGHAYVFAGSAAGLSSSPAAVLSGTGGDNDMFGNSIGAGDFDGDGYVDVIVGAPWSQSYSGSALLFRGGPAGLSSSPNATLAAPDPDGSFGSALAGVGDVNRDGYADAIVGAYLVKGPPYNEPGRAYLYLGGPSGLATTPAVTFQSPEPGEEFGATLAGVGDLDGDGYADFVIAGHPAVVLDGGGIQFMSSMYVYMGSAAGVSTAPAAALPGVPPTYAENSVAIADATDFDDDGYADLAAGASNTIIVYRGGPSGVASSPRIERVVSALSPYSYNFKISGGGDLDGDGHDDLVVTYDDVYVYPGSASGIAMTPSLTFTPPNDSATIYGYQLGGFGDVDGDGFADLPVGAPFDSNWIGRSYLFRGSAAGLITTPATTFTGTGTSGAQFGSAVRVSVSRLVSAAIRRRWQPSPPRLRSHQDPHVYSMS